MNAVNRKDQSCFDLPSSMPPPRDGVPTTQTGQKKLGCIAVLLPRLTLKEPFGGYIEGLRRCSGIRATAP